MSWEVITTQKLTREMILAILRNEVAAVRIPDFISIDTCKLAIKGIYEHGIDYYEGVYPKIGKIGITQFEHRFSDEKKTRYFAQAYNANINRKKSFQYSSDLTLKVVDFVRDGWSGKAGIAVEETSQEQYFAGLVRVMSRALLHIDWGQFDGPGWEIGKISGQIAWNIYLQMANTGGAITVYKHFWEPSDENHKIPGSYGYNYDVVKGCEKISLLPNQGELVFFSSKNFHEVNNADGELERITNSSFIGWIEKTNELIFWS